MKPLSCAMVLALGWTAVTSAQARKPVEDYVAAHQQQIVTEFVELLSIPNVAADRANIKRNADLLRTLFLKRGFAVEILPTDGNPLVFAELAVPGARRTILFYAHYDGQPIDPRRGARPTRSRLSCGPAGWRTAPRRFLTSSR